MNLFDPTLLKLVRFMEAQWFIHCCYYMDIHRHNHFVVIMQVNLCYLAPTVKNWRIVLEQSFTACLLLLMATSASERRGIEFCSTVLIRPSPYRVYSQMLNDNCRTLQVYGCHLCSLQ